MYNIKVYVVIYYLSYIIYFINFNSLYNLHSFNSLYMIYNFNSLYNLYMLNFINYLFCIMIKNKFNLNKMD